MTIITISTYVFGAIKHPIGVLETGEILLKLITFVWKPFHQTVENYKISHY
jgi:hypothetical protein